MIFSIIMPNRNKGKYIKQAIESVLKQSATCWELVIVDDASTDDSIPVISSFKDPRIKLFTRPNQVGPGGACMKAMENISGTHVGILDSDDLLDSSAVDTVIREYSAHPGCGMIYSQNMMVNPDLSLIGPGKSRAIAHGETALSTHDKEHCLRVAHWKTFTLEAYKKTPGFAAIPRCQDQDLVYKIEEVSDILFLDKILYYWRILPDGLHTGTTVSDHSEGVKASAKKRRGI